MGAVAEVALAEALESSSNRRGYGGYKSPGHRSTVTDVLIADDSLLLREGLAAVLLHEGISVVAKVDNVAALRAALKTTRPDVAIVGIPMPTVGRDQGVSAVERMPARAPGRGVLVLSGSFDPGLAVALISRRPARAGYLLKEPLPETPTLLRALRVVAGGGTLVDRGVVERIRTARSRPRSLDCLSAREREILALMAEGRTNHAISNSLCLSDKTVESHVRASSRNSACMPGRAITGACSRCCATCKAETSAGTKGLAGAYSVNRTAAAPRW